MVNQSGTTRVWIDILMNSWFKDSHRESLSYFPNVRVTKICAVEYGLSMWEAQILSPRITLVCTRVEITHMSTPKVLCRQQRHSYFGNLENLGKHYWMSSKRPLWWYGVCYEVRRMTFQWLPLYASQEWANIGRRSRLPLWAKVIITLNLGIGIFIGLWWQAKNQPILLPRILLRSVQNILRETLWSRETEGGGPLVWRLWGHWVPFIHWGSPFF